MTSSSSKYAKSKNVAPKQNMESAGCTYQAGIDVCEALDLQQVVPLQSNSAPTTELVEQYTEEDVSRYEARRTRGQKIKSACNEERLQCSDGGGISKLPHDLDQATSDQHIRQLRQTQNLLKKELEAAKDRLMIDKSRWSYECKSSIVELSILGILAWMIQ